MTDLPTCLTRGEPARLFPTVADTSRENRLTSIFLALVKRVPALADELFRTMGIRTGKRTRIRSWTEVGLAQVEDPDMRPDGLIEIQIGSRRINVLVEAKIKKNRLEEDQIAKYLEAAKACGIEYVLTISNQFVARTDQSPISVSKVLLRKVGLYHRSWTSIRTACELLVHNEAIKDPEQAFLIGEFLRLLAHKDTGVERFTSMGKDWPGLVKSILSRSKLQKTDPMIESAVECWVQEERDLALQLARHIGEKVDIVINRKLSKDADARRKAMSACLAGEHVLSSTFRIPDTASDVDITANVESRTIFHSMKLKANLDLKSTKARTRWLLKMLPEDDDRLYIRALWPGRQDPIQRKIKDVREDPAVLQPPNSRASPHGFDVVLVDDLSGDFPSTRKFIERLERGAVHFYDLVAQNLKAWQPSPPKPIRHSEDPGPSEAGMEDKVGDA